jgi:GTPase-activator protein for Ras-like GTPase
MIWHTINAVWCGGHAPSWVGFFFFLSLSHSSDLPLVLHTVHYPVDSFSKVFHSCFHALQLSNAFSFTLTSLVRTLFSTSTLHSTSPLHLRIELPHSDAARATTTECVVKHAESFPSALKYICTYIDSVVSVQFPRTSFTAVGGVLFLRLVCPAIVSPERVGLCMDKSPTRAVRRGLILAAKLLQNLSNGLEFDPDKEGFMTVFTPFIEANDVHMQRIMEAVIDPNLVHDHETDLLQEQLQTQAGLKRGGDRNPMAFARLHAYLLDRASELTSKLQVEDASRTSSDLSARVMVARRFRQVLKKLGEPDSYSECDSLSITELERVAAMVCVCVCWCVCMSGYVGECVCGLV